MMQEFPESCMMLCFLPKRWLQWIEICIVVILVMLMENLNMNVLLLVIEYSSYTSTSYPVYTRICITNIHQRRVNIAMTEEASVT